MSINPEVSTIEWAFDALNGIGKFRGVYAVAPQINIGPGNDKDLPLVVLSVEDVEGRVVGMHGISSQPTEIDFDISVWARQYIDAQVLLSDCRDALSSRLRRWDFVEDAFEYESKVYLASRTAALGLW